VKELATKGFEKNRGDGRIRAEGVEYWAFS
jgi:hypothetical protein